MDLNFRKVNNFLTFFLFILGYFNNITKNKEKDIYYEKFEQIFKTNQIS